MRQILELKSISYSYHTLEGETKAIDRLSFSVKEGEFIAIVGPSGCGKSTILHIITGLIRPEQGIIKFHSTDSAKDTPSIGYMLQQDELLEWRNIYQNVLLGLEIRHMLNAHTKKKAKELLDVYGLKDFAFSKPSELSGGMRQRAALIRTLILEPDLLLLDEPFSALDYQTRLSVANDIGQIIRSTGKTAILVTHDLSEAISLADRIVILSERPARVKQTISISFDNASLTPLERRDKAEFKNYFNLIWKELNHNE